MGGMNMVAVNLMGWNEILMYVIETVLKLVVAVAIPYGFNILRKKLKNDTQIKYLGKFEKLVADAVNQVQQTYVNNLKAQDMFDKEAQLEALAKVKSAVLNMMNNRMQEIVIDAVGDFDTYMRNLIESEVFKIKTSNKAVLAIESATETGA
jgi:hypothetical protein